MIRVFTSKTKSSTNFQKKFSTAEKFVQTMKTVIFPKPLITMMISLIIKFKYQHCNEARVEASEASIKVNILVEIF